MQNTKNSSQVAEFPNLRTLLFQRGGTWKLAKTTIKSKTSEKAVGRFNALTFLKIISQSNFSLTLKLVWSD